MYYKIEIVINKIDFFKVVILSLPLLSRMEDSSNPQPEVYDDSKISASGGQWFFVPEEQVHMTSMGQSTVDVSLQNAMRCMQPVINVATAVTTGCIMVGGGLLFVVGGVSYDLLRRGVNIIRN